MPAQQWVGDTPENNQVQSGMALAKTAFVFTKGYLQDPVQGVLYAPRARHGGQPRLRPGRAAGDEIAGVGGDLAPRRRTASIVTTRRRSGQRPSGSTYARMPDSRWPDRARLRCVQDRRGTPCGSRTDRARHPRCAPGPSWRVPTPTDWADYLWPPRYGRQGDPTWSGPARSKSPSLQS